MRCGVNFRAPAFSCNRWGPGMCLHTRALFSRARTVGRLVGNTFGSSKTDQKRCRIIPERRFAPTQPRLTVLPELSELCFLGWWVVCLENEWKSDFIFTRKMWRWVRRGGADFVLGKLIVTLLWHYKSFNSPSEGFRKWIQLNEWKDEHFRNWCCRVGWELFTACECNKWMLHFCKCEWPCFLFT